MNKKQILLKTGTYFGVFSIIAASVGVTTFYILKNSNNNPIINGKLLEANEIYHYNYDGDFINGTPTDDNNITIKLFGESIAPENINDIQLTNTKIVIDKLIEKFIDSSNYGPELASLKSININSDEFTNSDANGVYIPSTNEIALNASNFSTRIYTDNIDIDKKNNIMAEILFSILFHEYGHHMANVYASSPYNEANATSDIYSDSTTSLRIKNEWNQNFIDDFKSTLGYDVEEKFAFPDWDTGSRVLGNYYSAKSAFELANSFSGFQNDIYKYTPYVQSPNNSFNGTFLSLDQYNYFYSMEELYTRKLLLASMPWSIDALNGLTDYQKIPSLIEDHSFYATPYNVTNIGQNLSFDEFNTMSDYVYRDTLPSRASDLVDLLKKEIGAEVTEANLSFISFKNIFQYGTGGVLAHDTDQSWDDNTNQIKFGGMFDSQQNYQYVGYMNNQNFVALPITTHKTNILVKNSLLDFNPINTLGTTTSYATTNYVDASEIIDKKLYFSENLDGLNKVAMSTIRNNDYGIASTYIENLPYQYENVDDAIYIGNENNGDVSITSGTLWKNR